MFLRVVGFLYCLCCALLCAVCALCAVWCAVGSMAAAPIVIYILNRHFRWFCDYFSTNFKLCTVYTICTHLCTGFCCVLFVYTSFAMKHTPRAHTDSIQKDKLFWIEMRCVHNAARTYNLIHKYGGMTPLRVTDLLLLPVWIFGQMVCAKKNIDIVMV